ncbi:hypothetical protein [Clostridium tunisiense]|uniref:hypothetical protein n=1 Tax=Clostridium tunisiense TaxID=219748 RepID=UPI00031C5C91|nr:hypothetical protein [Clostridium tunisiense]
MNKRFYIIIGTIFLISSGFIYSIERLTSYIHWYLWTGQKMMEIPIPGTNIFIWAFVIIGLGFFVLGFRKKE